MTEYHIYNNDTTMTTSTTTTTSATTTTTCNIYNETYLATVQESLPSVGKFVHAQQRENRLRTHLQESH